MRYTRINIGHILGAILLCGFGVSVHADDPDQGKPESGKSMSEDQIEAWFNDDAEERALAVNEGELVFLSQTPDKPVHRSHNRLILDNNSLTTGWVRLIQCHSQLDAVPETQIIYRYRRMKDLRIESFSGISKAWVESTSVQLEGIQTGARLCVRAEVGILSSSSDGSFTLKNGPFHRKFLDGYYPMRVTLKIQFPNESIRFESLTPQVQAGFTLKQEKGELHINALFEGELTTEIRFTPIVPH